MYNNILVPMALDHGIGEKAIETARILLAKGGKITALHVYEAPKGTASIYLDEELVQKAYSRAKSELEKRVESFPEVEPAIIKGHSGRGIIDFASEIHADCIIVGSHNPGLIDYLLGSTAARVVRHAPCSVHVLRNVT